MDPDTVRGPDPGKPKLLPRKKTKKELDLFPPEKFSFFAVLGIRIRMFFRPPGSGSISQRCGSGRGAFPFLIKVLIGLK
jgi:hypothetical protein